MSYVCEGSFGGDNVIKFLINYGIKPNMPDNEGYTPFIAAVLLKDYHTYALLLLFSKDNDESNIKNYINMQKNTVIPLHYINL